MAVKTRVMEDVGVVKVKGNLIGGDETTEVHEAVKRLVAEDIKKIVIDLHRVKWMNSHGIGMLMGCYSTAQNAQGKLAVSRISDKVKDLLTMTQVIKLFDVFESVHQAVKAMV